MQNYYRISLLLMMSTILFADSDHYPFVLPPLPYAYNALEPHIDEQTMKLHHDKHHQGYVDALNKALADCPDLHKKTLEELVRGWKKLPRSVRTAVRNQAGGHLNHSLFWQWMAPSSRTMPQGPFYSTLLKTFESFDEFKKQFSEKAKAVFGSGWVWLCMNRSGQLCIVTTKNQDNPIVAGLYPLLGLDVWEHAYYLRYKNERLTYLDAWWQVVNWPEVERLYGLYQ